MSVVYRFLCDGNEVVVEYPSPRVARTLRANANEAFEAVFGMETKKRTTCVAHRALVNAGIEALLDVCRNKPTTRSKPELSAWGFRTVYECEVSEVETGSTGKFQLEPDGNFFRLSARNGRSCLLEEFVEGVPDWNGNRFQKIGEKELPAGTVIRPCCYKTWYIVSGGRPNFESVVHDLVRLRDALLGGDMSGSVTISILV